MTNPFDDQNGSYTVLTNVDGQHSLWPADIDAPAGWAIVHGPADRGTCLEYVKQNWTDIRPRSLVAHLDA
ncbi:MAG TPA: MbtH family protein [Pseudonocardiaceae bacterium]|jgi:MbtH protein